MKRIALASSNRFLQIIVVLLAIAGAIGASSAQMRKPAASKPEDQFATAIRARIQNTLDQLSIDGEFSAAEKSLTDTFDQVIAYAQPSEKQLFYDAAFALRLVRQSGASDKAARLDQFKCLRENDDLARTLVFAMKPETEKPADVLAVLDRLRAKHAAILNKYADLAAAICIVHDRPLERQINENRVAGPDPVALFEYFVSNEKRMYFGVQNVPAEVLIYVVDAAASINELNWALQRYAGNKNVGGLFFDIKYDWDNFQDDKPKKVTLAGYNLPNILKLGGVCADQAYFATTVGKAIGVPTATASGASSEVSHAWVGFIQSDGRRSWWNFDTGRYEAYQGVRGMVEDPQIRKLIPDSYVSLVADFVMCKEIDRRAAAAMSDAAARLLELQQTKARFAPPPPEGIERQALRTPTTADALALLETGLSGSPGYAGGWMIIQKLAADGQLTLDDKKKWEGILFRLCGQRYPDFYLAVLAPMIRTVDDLKEQNAFWNAAFQRFSSRPDLAASVRMEQADMFMREKNPGKAMECYQDVINRFSNAGPFVLEALVKAETLLQRAGNDRAVVGLYEHAWSLIHKPKNDMGSAFASQSNWYRVGSMYAKRLEQAGMGGEAGKVRTAIKVK